MTEQRFTGACRKFGQCNYLISAEKKLGVGPVEMARLLDTPYNTYKAWKSERNVMPGAAYVAIDLLTKQA